jgi:NodT family efflux transporter outer membrane factor (OMF) lipoprotein
VQSRLSAGLVAERDVAQAATNVETTRSRLPQLEAAAITSLNRLAVLLGGTPELLPAELRAVAPLPQLPAAVAVGAPADLLRRRPDVQRAERLLAGEVARIGVAEAERYPSFSLSGQIGLAANSAKQFFDADSDLFGFGPSLRWNLFDGGRLKHRIQALEASAEAAQIAYEQTVLLALEETENAMTRFGLERVRRASLARAAAQARRAVELAQTQYREGLSDFQAVLDSQRIAATIDDDLVNSDAAVATHLIALFKALGGGLPR